MRSEVSLRERAALPHGGLLLTVECPLILVPASFGVLIAFGQGQQHGKTQESLA